MANHQNKFRTGLAGFIALGSLSAIVLVFFQNCMEFPNEQAQLPQLGPTPVPTAVPFAFKLDFDTAAHMSCELYPTTVNRSAYATFRVAARNTGAGIGLSNELYSALFANAANRATTFLAEEPNRDLQIQMSARNAERFATSEPARPSNAPILDGLKNMWPVLSSNSTEYNRIANLSVDTFINTYASQKFNVGITYVSGVSQIKELVRLGNTHIVGVGFRGPNVGLNADQRQYVLQSAGVGAYGSGMQFTYSPPMGTDNYLQGGANRATRTLASARVYDMKDFRSIRTLQCPAYLQFRIVPFGKEADAGCITTYGRGTAIPAGEATNAYNIADFLLNQGTRYWHIDPVNRCVIPANAADSTCYPPVSGQPPEIEWSRVVAAPSCGSGSAKECPHFFSVCIR